MIEFLVGMAVGVIVFYMGWFAGIRRSKFREETKKSVCDCEHSIAFHNPKNGECYGIVEKIRYDTMGVRRGIVQVSCTCVQYTGPQPITEYYVPEIENRED